MKFDVILGGIGGQGIRTAGAILARAAARTRLTTLRSALYPVDARGGAVLQHLRIADYAIDGSHVRPGEADLILGLEPVEALRSLDFLSPAGALITESEPVPNIPSYPSLQEVHWSVLELRNGFLVDAFRLARAAGGARVANVVLIGAASDFLPFEPDDLRAGIVEVFQGKGERVVEVNLAAFDAGREALQHREIVDEFDTFAGPRR